MKQAVLAYWFIGMDAARLWACPFCHSETGKQVRAEIFGEDFLLNTALTLIPIPILVGIIGLIYFGIPVPRREDSEDG